MTSDSDDALTWDGGDGEPASSSRPRPKRRASVEKTDVAAASTPTEPRGAATERSIPQAGSSDRAPSSSTPSAPVPTGGASGRRLLDVDDLDEDDTDEVGGLSTAMLLTLGVIGGIYLLYSIGWVVGGLRLQPLASFFVVDAMFLPWFVLAVAAPALWFLTVWVLTRHRATWIRIGALVLGVILLVPWPFVTVGAIG